LAKDEPAFGFLSFDRPSALKYAVLLSILAHLFAGLFVIFLIPEERKERGTPFVTRLITPEELESKSPPRGEQAGPIPRQGQPIPRPQRQVVPQRPLIPKTQKSLKTPNVLKPVIPRDNSQHGIEGEAVTSKLHTATPSISETGKGQGETQRSAAVPAQPHGKTLEPPGSPPTPSLREKLFDREVVGKIARREDIKKDNSLTFDTQEFKYYTYMIRLKERIESVWKYPQDAAMRGVYGDLYIRFTIRKNGSLEDVELMRTSGHRNLDEAAQQALKDAQPYWPLPDEWGKDSLTITGHFVYSIYGTLIR
jgi:periplasmic protein TonB